MRRDSLFYQLFAQLPLSLALMKLMTLSRSEMPTAARLLVQSAQGKAVEKWEVIYRVNHKNNAVWVH